MTESPLIDLGGRAAVRAQPRVWEFALHPECPPLRVEMPSLVLNDRLVSLDRVADVRVAGGEARETSVLFHTPELPGLRAILELQSRPGQSGVRLSFTVASDRHAVLRRPADEVFLRYELPAGSNIHEQRIGDFDPAVHSYRPRSRPVTAPAQGSVRLVGPLIHARCDDREIVVAHEGPVEAETAFWAYRLAGDGTLNVVAEAGAMLSHQDVQTDPWRSETLQLVVAPSEGLVAFQRFFGAIASPAGEHDLAYNTWHRQELSHHVDGVPYLSRINPRDLAEELEDAAEMGVRYFTVDVGWFEKSGDWEPHSVRFAGGIRHWADLARAQGVGLGLWLNPMVAGLSSEAINQYGSCRMTYEDRLLEPEPIWETEHSAPMCLASEWREHMERVLERLAAEGVKKVKFDGLWPASYEWAGRAAVYECDSAAHHHGDASHSPDERRARYRYLAAVAATRLSEKAAQLGMTAELDITESYRYPRLGQAVFGRLFLINNGPYFHDLGVPSSTRITPNTFNAVFYPHPTHSRIQRTAGLFSAFLPVGRVFGHVLLGDESPGAMASAVATAALTGMAIWGDLSRLSGSQREAVRAALLGASRARKAMLRPRTIIDGFVGSSPEIHLHIDDATGKTILGVFTHQPVNLSAEQFSQVHAAAPAAGRSALEVADVTLGNDGAVLVLPTNQ